MSEDPRGLGHLGFKERFGHGRNAPGRKGARTEAAKPEPPAGELVGDFRFALRYRLGLPVSPDLFRGNYPAGQGTLVA